MAEEKIQKKEIDYLKELIGQSGFPLEIEIASFLESMKTSMNWEFMEVCMGAYYLDEDENKGKELDIKAEIPVFCEEKIKGKQVDSASIFIDLLIECKRIPGNAWVFFKTPQKIFSDVKSTSVLDSLEWNSRAHVDFAYLTDIHYKHAQKAILRHEYILDRKTSNKRNDNLFDAAISLAKATNYELETTIETLKSEVKTLSTEEYDLLKYALLFYPIVVFDGKMYLAEKTEEYGQMDLTPTDYVCLSFNYLSRNYNTKLCIDIIQRESFKKFFSSILVDIENLRKALKNKVGIKFRREIKKALDWYVHKKRSVYA